MNNWPTQQEVEHIRSRYQAGMRIELLRMGDVQAPPAGTRGTIITVDDVGDLVVAWDNGCGLKLIPSVDAFRIIPDEPEPRGDT